MSVGHAAIATFTNASGPTALTVKAVRRLGVIGIASLFGLLAVSMVEGATNRVGFQSCRLDPVLPRFGAEIETTMLVSRGTACSMRVRTASISINDLTIIKSPSHGALRMRGRTGVIYQPAARFAGEDSFAFQITGREDGVSKTSIAWVRVSVQ